ncbi:MULTISPECIES: isoprenyl transferase [unclassified Streptococcus]|uniref:isoprenyl transferase n=1 Tax=unclassified Streptococcus TaxID=2608887 RepID=UPI001071F988|nr:MULTISPECIES: isoprenyl transferase [unclassified Streptococcus]MBF0806721.1 isoprenyl transferase [Streptococcus sp. 19428wA2_WM07]TFU26461.1 isoprenyl transferase [Streptococcus sp. WM07]
MFGFKKKEEQLSLVVPKHIGIIMDGNGRWAQKRMQPRAFGHKAGMEALQAVAKAASQMGIRVLTVYAFSTENWSRPEKEVKFIMNLPVEFYDRYIPELHRQGVKIQMIGDVGRLPSETLASLRKAEQLTANNTGMILNFALNYGGRAEIQEAVRVIVEKVQAGIYGIDQITDELIGSHLYTGALPEDWRDPELIIRTSGELRLSNFLPWQSAYSELYFTDTLWPDFTAQSLEEAIEEYNRRNRRFGGV